MPFVLLFIMFWQQLHPIWFDCWGFVCVAAGGRCSWPNFVSFAELEGVAGIFV